MILIMARILANRLKGFFIVQLIKLLTEVLIFIKICRTNFTKSI